MEGCTFPEFQASNMMSTKCQSLMKSNRKEFIIRSLVCPSRLIFLKNFSNAIRLSSTSPRAKIWLTIYRSPKSINAHGAHQCAQCAHHCIFGARYCAHCAQILSKVNFLMCASDDPTQHVKHEEENITAMNYHAVPTPTAHTPKQQTLRLRVRPG